MKSRQEIDDDLMIKAGRGDEIAFNQIVQAHSNSVHHFLMRYLYIKADADELTSETFFRAWRQAPKWQKNGAKLTTWLFSVANNLAIDRLRASKNSQFNVEMEDDLVDPNPTPLQISEGQDRLSLVKQQIDKLPTLQQQALLLQTVEEAEIVEIAEILGKSRGAVEQLLVRARQNLRRMMKEMDE